MMKNIRYTVEAFVLLFFFMMSKIMPVSWASNIGGAIGRLVGPRLAASRKAIAHVSIAFPDISTNQKKLIVKGMWDNLGRVMMEYPHLTTIGKSRVEIVGIDILERYRSKPAIFVSAHTANWETCPPALLLQHHVISCPIYRAPNNPFSDFLLQYARTLGGKIETIPKSKSGTRNIVKTLKDNKFIGMVIDQKYNEGIAVDFFGEPAMTSPIFVQLAQKFDCPVIPIKIERLKGCNFRITIIEPLEIKDKRSEDIILEFNTLLEAWIKEKPEQWLWLHKRWGKIK